jgi:hypothetical protein
MALEQLQNTLGGGVDNVFLALPRLINLARSVKLDRATYEKKIDFYYDQGYVDNPSSFFTFPESKTSYDIIDSRPWREGRKELIAYPSAYMPRNPLVRDQYASWKRNSTGYLVRWTHGDRGRKTVLCLHGYMLGEPAQAEGMFRIPGLFNQGLDVALFITPFHWKRGHRSARLRGVFLQPEDAVMTWERFGQTMYDLRATMDILRDLGANDVGIYRRQPGRIQWCPLFGPERRPRLRRTDGARRRFLPAPGP